MESSHKPTPCCHNMVYQGSTGGGGGGAAYIFPKFPVPLCKAGRFMTQWLYRFCPWMCAGWAEALLWAALEEKRNGVTASGQGGKPWIMLGKREPERRIRVSQWVTRRWGCLLLWVQGKFSCIALGKLEKWGWGRKKTLREGTDESTGERVKLVGRRSPKEWDHRGELPGKKGATALIRNSAYRYKRLIIELVLLNHIRRRVCI